MKDSFNLKNFNRITQKDTRNNKNLRILIGKLVKKIRFFKNFMKNIALKKIYIYRNFIILSRFYACALVIRYGVIAFL